MSGAFYIFCLATSQPFLKQILLKQYLNQEKTQLLFIEGLRFLWVWSGLGLGLVCVWSAFDYKKDKSSFRKGEDMTWARNRQLI
jgi:hypothetical protein